MKSRTQTLFAPLVALLVALLARRTQQQAQDSFTIYGASNTPAVTAMDINYAGSIAVFANTNREVVKYSIAVAPTIALQTLATAHKAEISSLALSPNMTLLLTGGRDYTARVYNLVTSALVCTFDELRGDIISSKIAADNNFYAFASN